MRIMIPNALWPIDPALGETNGIVFHDRRDRGEWAGLIRWRGEERGALEILAAARWIRCVHFTYVGAASLLAAIHRVIPVKAAAVTLADKVAPQQPGPRYFPCPDADAVKRNARARAH